MIKKPIITESRLNVGIVESYKKADPGSPVLGTFGVKSMTVENAVSQNRTRYSSEVWNTPNSFGAGGKFMDESRKLKPTSLLGSLDHPLDDRAELTLSEAAIAWTNVTRNEDGSWDGEADILDTPQGRICKTMLEYAKLRGGGELLGVSSRALGDSETVQESSGYIEDIIPESYDLMSFDFVYNPSFTNKASLTESKKALKTLTESIKDLAKEDKDHAEVYESFLERLSSKTKLDTITEMKSKVDEIRDAYLDALEQHENDIVNAIYKLKKMSDEDFQAKYGQKSRESIQKKLEAELEKAKEALYSTENGGPLETPLESTEPVVEDNVEPITEETVVEQTAVEILLEGNNEGNKRHWTKANIGNLIKLGFINAVSLVSRFEKSVEKNLGERGVQELEKMSAKEKLKGAARLVSDESIKKYLEPWAIDFHEQISEVQDPEQLYRMQPQNVVDFISKNQDNNWCQLKLKELQDNVNAYKAVLGEENMKAESMNPVRRGYRVNVTPEQADGISKHLDEQAIEYQTSEYNGKIRFDLSCNMTERIELNRLLSTLNESALRIQKKNLFEADEEGNKGKINESDIIDDFADDEDDPGLDNDDPEEDPEEEPAEDEDPAAEEDEDLEEDPEEEEPAAEPTLQEVYDLMLEIKELLVPVEEAELDDLGDLEDEDLLDDDIDEEEAALLDDLDEEDLDEMEDEELDYLLDLEESRNK